MAAQLFVSELWLWALLWSLCQQDRSRVWLCSCVGWAGFLLIRLLCKKSAHYQFANTPTAFLRTGLCGKCQQWNFGVVLLCCSCCASPFGWYLSKGCHHKCWMRSSVSLHRQALAVNSVSDCGWELCLPLFLWPLVHCLQAHGSFLVKHFSTREIKIFMLFLEMLKATLDPDLTTSTLIRWCLPI